MGKKYKKKDPFHKREASSYEHPVPSREFLLAYFKDMASPRSFKQVVSDFELTKQQHLGVKRRLRAMERDNQLMKNRRGSYALLADTEVIRGSIQVHRDGFGFLIPDEGGSDLFLPARQVRGLFTDDVVLARVVRVSPRGRREGIVVEVVEHNTHQVVGRLILEDGVGFVAPHNNETNQDIIIAEHDLMTAKSGDFVAVALQPSVDRKRQLKGKIVEILGDHLTPGLEVDLAMRSHELPYMWSEDIEREQRKFPQGVLKSEHKNRRDLRTLPFVTIDGEDARDFDDAVFCQENSEGWCVYVAIADVSHYVKPKSFIDTEAIDRGNSVYFPSRVIPMLPEALSNELCSLKPNVDRLAMVCQIQLDSEGGVLYYEFYQALIHSHARLTYTEVAHAIEHQSGLPKNLLQQVQSLYIVFSKLIKKRNERGAIDFDTLESRIVFDGVGKIECIVALARNDAHRLIEELMLLANACSADLLLTCDLPVLFRNHDIPDPEKLDTLREFIQMFGLQLTGGDTPTAADYSRLLDRIRRRPEVHLLQTVLLRSMKQAKFETSNRGHFGLAYEAYCQFTSPIRRYPDLLVHRCIKKIIAAKGYKKYPYTQEKMKQLGEHFSMTERRADRATRDATDWLKCDYMKDKVGQKFSGIISDVLGFGFFVELEEVYINGLVHISNIDDDYYHFDSSTHSLIGRSGKNTYRLGDKIHIIVARVDVDQRKIDFDIDYQ